MDNTEKALIAMAEAIKNIGDKVEVIEDRINDLSEDVAILNNKESE